MRPKYEMRDGKRRKAAAMKPQPENVVKMPAKKAKAKPKKAAKPDA